MGCVKSGKENRKYENLGAKICNNIAHLLRVGFSVQGLFFSLSWRIMIFSGILASSEGA